MKYLFFYPFKRFLKIVLKRELIYLLIDFHQDLSSFRGTLSWDIIAWQAFEREGASGTRGGSRARLVTFPFRFERLLRGLDINRSFFLQVTLIQRAIFLPILAFLPLSFGQKFSYFVWTLFSFSFNIAQTASFPGKYVIDQPRFQANIPNLPRCLLFYHARSTNFEEKEEGREKRGSVKILIVI